MKTIKKLKVKVTFQVGLGNVKVSNKIFEQLNEITENGGEIDGMRWDCPESLEWLKENIRERDCFNLNYEITELD